MTGPTLKFVPYPYKMVYFLSLLNSDFCLASHCHLNPLLLGLFAGFQHLDWSYLKFGKCLKRNNSSKCRDRFCTLHCFETLMLWCLSNIISFLIILCIFPCYWQDCLIRTRTPQSKNELLVIVESFLMF